MLFFNATVNYLFLAHLLSILYYLTFYLPKQLSSVPRLNPVGQGPHVYPMVLLPCWSAVRSVQVLPPWQGDREQASNSDSQCSPEKTLTTFTVQAKNSNCSVTVLLNLF